MSGDDDSNDVIIYTTLFTYIISFKSSEKPYMTAIVHILQRERNQALKEFSHFLKLELEPSQPEATAMVLPFVILSPGSPVFLKERNVNNLPF